jgi:hypothetical protein
MTLALFYIDAQPVPRCAQLATDWKRRSACGSAYSAQHAQQTILVDSGFQQ